MLKDIGVPPPESAMADIRSKRALHPRNRHQGEYDFVQLIGCSPQLRPFVTKNVHGYPSIDFADAAAVRALNRALLQTQYGVDRWELPPGYLCPPVPGRADYVHGVADLLAQDNGGVIPVGSAARILDIGTGASCIYPLIGQREYGWRFVGTDIDPAALASAQATVNANPGLKSEIELRLQTETRKVFAGVVAVDDDFALTLCNPPFHASAGDVRQASERKWRNLGKYPQGGAGEAAPRLNFGGQSNELWCPGGEAAFVRQMIEESAALSQSVVWFTSLISRGANLPAVKQHLKKIGASMRVVSMAQGRKQSRFVAWSFLDALERAARVRRWN